MAATGLARRTGRPIGAPQDRGARVLRPALLLFSAGALVGLGATQLDFRLLVPVAVALPLTVVTVLRQQSLAQPSVVEDDGAPAWWLGPAIFALFLVSELRILSWATTRSSAAVVEGSISLDIVIELGATMAVLAAVGMVFLRGWDAPVPPVAWVAALFPAMAVASTVWSELRLISAARGLQYLAAAGTMLYGAGWARRAPLATLAAIERGLRLLVPVLLALVAWGWVSPSWWDGRFAWPGTHPIAGTSLLGVPVILLAASDRRNRITAPVPWWLVVALFGVTMLRMQSRGPLVGVVLGVLAVVLMRSRRDTRIAAVTGALVLVAVGVALMSTTSLVSYALRGKSADTIGSLSGRTELWDHVLANPIGSEIWGVGIGANRTALLQAFPWAGNAHNTWLDLLQNLGVIGVALAAAALLTVIVVSLRAPHPGALGLAVFLLVTSITTPAFGQPGAEAMALFLAVVLVSLPVRPDASPGPTGAFLRPRRVAPGPTGPADSRTGTAAAVRAGSRAPVDRPAGRTATRHRP